MSTLGLATILGINSTLLLSLLLFLPPSLPRAYQWRKALRRNMAVNCSETRFQTSCTAVEFPMKVVDIYSREGGREGGGV